MIGHSRFLPEPGRWQPQADGGAVAAFAAAGLSTAACPSTTPQEKGGAVPHPQGGGIL